MNTLSPSYLIYIRCGVFFYSIELTLSFDCQYFGDCKGIRFDYLKKNVPSLYDLKDIYKVYFQFSSTTRNVKYNYLKRMYKLISTEISPVSYTKVLNKILNMTIIYNSQVRNSINSFILFHNYYHLSVKSLRNLVSI